RTLYVNAMTNNNGAHHRVHAIDLSNGSDRAGWPVNVDSTATSDGVTFLSPPQNQRAALALVGGRVYVPYGGHIGDSGDSHGWVVGSSTTSPKNVGAGRTRPTAGGIWGTSGIASDGTSIFFVTGNTMGHQDPPFTAPGMYGDGESVYKLGATLTRTTTATD